MTNSIDTRTQADFDVTFVNLVGDLCQFDADLRALAAYGSAELSD